MRADSSKPRIRPRLGRWAAFGGPSPVDDEPRSVFHGLSTGAVPSNMKAAVGRRWETRAGPHRAGRGPARSRRRGRVDPPEQVGARRVERAGGLQVRAREGDPVERLERVGCEF